jgi:hypothetical protein
MHLVAREVGLAYFVKERAGRGQGVGLEEQGVGLEEQGVG